MRQMLSGGHIMPERFHQMQFKIAGGLCAVSMVGYMLAPRDRADLIGVVIGTLIGFLTGKFSNGFSGRGKGAE